MGKIQFLLLGALSVFGDAQAEPLSNFPDWNMVPAQNGWFLLTPPDERKPIMIPTSAASKLEIAATTPENLYQQFTNSAAKRKKDENVWKKEHGFYVQEDKGDNEGEISSMTPDGSSEKDSSESSSSGPMVIGGSSASSVPSNKYGNSAGSAKPYSGGSVSSGASSAPNSGGTASASKSSGGAATGASSYSPFINEEAAKAKVVLGQNKVQEMKSGEVKAPPPPPPAPTCENAASLGVLKEEIKELSFAATNSTCEFGVGDNLGRNNGRVTARREQVDSFEIPAKAVICDLSISSNSSSMRYDDHYMFIFNGYILSSNLTTALNSLDTDAIKIKSGNTEKSVNGKKYDWLKIRGKDGNDGSYCIGEASCQWPATERQGAVNLQLNSDLAKAIAAKSSSGKQEFKYIISGDDNNSDCQHSGLQLKANLKYYVP
jgi:hypothetical protein